MVTGYDFDYLYDCIDIRKASLLNVSVKRIGMLTKNELMNIKQAPIETKNQQKPL